MAPFSTEAQGLLKGAAPAHRKSVARDLSLFDLGIGPMYLKRRPVLLALTVSLLNADVGVENVVAEKASGSGVELSSAGRKACETRQIVMKSSGMVYRFFPKAAGVFGAGRCRS